MGEDKSTHHIAENRNREACHSPVKEYVTLTCRVPTARASFVKSILLFCCYQRHLPKLIWSCINSQNTLGCFFLIRKFKFSSVILSPFPSLKNLFSLVSVIQKKKKTICNSMEWGRGGATQFFSFAQIILSILQSSFHSPRLSWSARPLNKYISTFLAWNACAHQSGPAAWVWDTHSHSGPQAQKGQCLA